MKKILRIVRIEQLPRFSSEGVSLRLSLIDYKPETETTNPFKEKFDAIQKMLEDKGRDLPPDIKAVIDLFANIPAIGQPPPAPMGALLPMYAPSSDFRISAEEYELLGKPEIGSLISVEFQPEKEPE